MKKVILITLIIMFAATAAWGMRTKWLVYHYYAPQSVVVAGTTLFDGTAQLFDGSTPVTDGE